MIKIPAMVDGKLPPPWRAAPGPDGLHAWIDADAEGAIPRKTYIVKVVTEPRDTHRIGAKGTVAGSARVNGTLLYFVRWDDKPEIPDGIVGWKIREAFNGA